MQNTSFGETQTMLRALEFALAKGGFGKNNSQQKIAVELFKKMKSNQSVSGRHQQLSNMLKKGATIEQLIKATATSRRTIFRYLNHFEDAGIDIALEHGRYKLKK